ncbi:hypothetical protein KIPB_016278, partial [Kipferlia bialata]|eukprot:g16278.t1
MRLLKENTPEFDE